MYLNLREWGFFFVLGLVWFSDSTVGRKRHYCKREMMGKEATSLKLLSSSFKALSNYPSSVCIWLILKIFQVIPAVSNDSWYGGPGNINIWSYICWSNFQLCMSQVLGTISLQCKLFCFSVTCFVLVPVCEYFLCSEI